MKAVVSEVQELQAELAQARALVARASERVESLRGRLGDLERLKRTNTDETLNAVDNLTSQQTSTMEQARERGQGPGLYRVIDEAKELDAQQRELVSTLKSKPHDDETRRSTFQRFLEIEQKQYDLLMTEVGKFEAQGLRELLDTFVALSQQQRAIISQLVDKE